MIQYPNDADGNALARIAADGIDMSKPLLIEFAIDAPNEAAANAIAKTLNDKNYKTDIYYDEGELDDDVEPDSDEFGPSWTVYANVEMVPEYKRIIEIQETLDAYAKQHGGTADGWGTLVE